MQGLKTLDLTLSIEPAGYSFLSLDEIWVHRLLELQHDRKCLRNVEIISQHDNYEREDLRQFKSQLREKLSQLKSAC